jgi:hypothetical protein
VQDAEILLQTLISGPKQYNETYSEIRFDLAEINPVSFTTTRVFNQQHFQGNKKLWTMQFERSEKLQERAFEYEKIDYGRENGTRRYIQMFAFVDRLFPSFIAKYVVVLTVCNPP